MHTVLVLGGYGFFGARICTALCEDATIRVLIAGRDETKARQLAGKLGLPVDHGLGLDAHSPTLAQTLREHGVNTVIHTAGPFQGQGYAVARAAIAAQANYIDLADGRDFVAGIAALDASARAAGVLVTSGASSLPALSSAVVDRYLPRFSRLDAIRQGIGSGARTPGLATMRGVFSYCGKPFQHLEQGRQQTVHGWLDSISHRFPAPIGLRRLGSCDVPDLSLFPPRYAGVRSVSFHAGFASLAGHLVVWSGAQLVRLGLLSDLASWAALLNRISGSMEPLFSDKGGMFVRMEGIGTDGQALTLTWHVVAAQNHGPHIPCGASIALARKLARADDMPRGARPCMGLVSVEEYLAALKGFDVRELPA